MTPTPRYRTGESVLYRATQEMGRIDDHPVLVMGEWIYKIQFAKKKVKIAEDDLEPLGSEESIYDLISRGAWGLARTFRVAMAVSKIRNAHPNALFAFRAQRILFEPFQYKPLLKFLESPDRRLLVADEVGLGKTIEAGLILAELEARHSRLDRVLVLCPSRLRDKWHDELSRKFGREFTKATREDFAQYVQNVQRNPERTAFRFIASMQTLRREDVRTPWLDHVADIDLLIVDEAHHARNRDNQIHQTVRDLCDKSVAVLFLTATPVNLGTDDLFNLLDVLRPKSFGDPRVFRETLESHAEIHRAAQIVRRQQTADLAEIGSILRRLFVDSVPADRRDPLAMRAIEALDEPPRDRREWVDLERRIQELHPLSSIVTRTRKRDVIQNAAIRDPHVLRCKWTQEEEAAYQVFVGGAGQSGWNRGRMSIGQIQRARQAASCLRAAIAGSRVVLNDDEAAEWTDIAPSEWEGRPVGDQSTPTVAAVEADTKLATLLELLEEIQSTEPGAKVLIFTFFLGTSRYLQEQLNARGIRAERIAGDVPSYAKDPNQDLRGQAIDRFRDDPTVRVMISTEVGSEGLDFQFCHFLVNYDLPWNPMVVEQRIGRIDRFGQTHGRLGIFNIVIEGSVEDRILNRLYERIGIFRSSLGPLESILGDAVTKLLHDYVDGTLSPEQAEARADAEAQILVNRTAHLEELESKAANLIGHEEYIRDQLGRVERLGRYMTEKSLLAVIEAYLLGGHANVKIVPQSSGIYWIRVTDSLRHEIQAQSPPGQVWVDHSGHGDFQFCFNGEIAYRNPGVELINVSHPFVKAAAAAIEKQLEGPRARVGRAVVQLGPDEMGIVGGQYLVAVFLQSIVGVRPRVVVDPVCWSFADETLLPVEVGERLMHLALETGEDWGPQAEPKSVTPDIWEALSAEAIVRNRRLDASEKAENGAQYIRRKNLIDAEYRHKLASLDVRIRSAQERADRERYVKLLKAQRQKAEGDWHRRVADLDAAGPPSCTLSDDPVAVCLILVR